MKVKDILKKTNMLEEKIAVYKEICENFLESFLGEGDHRRIFFVTQDTERPVSIQVIREVISSFKAEISKWEKERKKLLEKGVVEEGEEQ